jgi:predicted membrane channel-forming protein YqfA (hemolysin III family)
MKGVVVTDRPPAMMIGTEVRQQIQGPVANPVILAYWSICHYCALFICQLIFRTTDFNPKRTTVYLFVGFFGLIFILFICQLIFLIFFLLLLNSVTRGNLLNCSNPMG